MKHQIPISSYIKRNMIAALNLMRALKNEHRRLANAWPYISRFIYPNYD